MVEKTTDNLVKISTMTNSKFGSLREYLIARREELGLTQEQLAKSSGVPRGTIAALEVGQVTGAPRVDTLAKLAKALRVDLESLVAITMGDEPKRKPDGEGLTPAQREILDLISDMDSEEHDLVLRMLRRLRGK